MSDPAAWALAGVGGYDWQSRMRAEATAMDMQRLLRQGRLVFPKKENIMEPPCSSRYAPSPSARASRWAKDCQCFPPPRWVAAPTRLSVPHTPDELSLLVAQRRYATYTDYLTGSRHPLGTIPLVPHRRR